MEPWFTTPNDLFSEFDNFGQQFSGTHLPPGLDMPPPHEQALDGQFIADQNHSYAPPDLAFDSFIQGFQDGSSIDNMDGLRTTQITTTPSTDPPRKSRKKKAPTLREEDWEPFKDRILDLYETQKLPLERVKTMIEEEFGFTAQLRQYQSRITKWRKDKNIKKVEMAAIVRKQQQRKILEPDKRNLCFTVRDREVETDKINRWMDRNNVPRNDLYVPSPAASTPSAVDCRTISERGSLAHSPALSEMSLAFSSGDITPVAQSPAASSPALSVRGIIQGHGSTFTGQSPAPFYQALPAQPPAPYPSSTSPVHPHSSSILFPQPYRYRQADEDRLRSELSVAETLFGPEDAQTLYIVIMLGKILLEQGRYKSASEMIRRAVTGYQKTVGGDDIRTLDAWELLGLVLGRQGFYRQASKLLKGILEAKRVTLGEEHLSTLSCMFKLSRMYSGQRRWVETAFLSKRVLEVAKRVRGEADYVTLRSMADLGFAYMWLGRSEESRLLIENALKLSMDSFGGEHATTLNIMNSLAVLYAHESEWGQAEVIAMQLINTHTRTIGKEHPTTMLVKAILVPIYGGLGQLKKAEETAEQVLEVRKRILGEKHPDTLYTTNLLVDVYEKQKEYGKAQELRRYIQKMEGGVRA
ncbi:hypothetical protein FGADI_10512 [Fusarium gaditjirri]|uniref:Clr5 domain-containing protein n=1 Tax=Fusarium gaditjirri TaxID=282569 RepID=A0A8H4SXB8_9HYPO|nr:hypothetical protein FGADI_10512 [Fusarium gaditjirri]